VRQEWLFLKIARVNALRRDAFADRCNPCSTNQRFEERLDDAMPILNTRASPSARHRSIGRRARAVLARAREVCGNVGQGSFMQEIRLCWSRGQVDENGRPVTGGRWFPATPVNRELAERVRQAGEAIYGVGSHWIEERKA